MVRNGGTKPHQGWDLLAYPGTRCHAVADGQIVYARNTGGAYGLVSILRFHYQGRRLFAAYCHPSSFIEQENSVVFAGQPIAKTGNASSMEGDDQHLHFEFRTQKSPSLGLTGRIDPAEIYYDAPLNSTVQESRMPGALSQLIGISGTGLKFKGVTHL